MIFDSIVSSRHSTRAYANRPVDQATLEEILSVAGTAPSSSNIQPWRVYVLQGQALESLGQTVSDVYAKCKQDPDLAKQYQEQFNHYPTNWISPYIDRRRETGKNLYKLLGIPKEDQIGMIQQHQKNYKFFGAPVGLFFTNDGDLGIGSLVDTGMFIQNIALAAHARGLGTCVQGCWCRYHSIVLPHIGAKSNETLVCGMALGWPDDSDKINTYHPNRLPLSEFVKWCK